ncbi:MAG TPA: hypothetical protein VF021_09440 [Longimicrobiales bacterium]
MRTCRYRIVGAALLLLGLQTSLRAQRAQPTFDAQRDSSQMRTARAWRPLRIAKWSTFAASTAAVVYGFSQNRVADREYASIEQLCKDAPDQCTRTGTDTYADAALEARYQNVVTRDDHARLALTAGQLGIAASVLLFVLDLHDDAVPKDVPYEPRPLQLDVNQHGIMLRFRHRTR